MIGESHAIFGAVATGSLLIERGYGPDRIGAGSFVLAVALGGVIALLPDIDSPNTLARQMFGIGSLQARKNLSNWRHKDLITNLVNFVRWFISLLFDFLAWILPHRGPTHWLIVAVPLCWIVYYYSSLQGWSPIYWQAFTIGYISHLVADSFTIAGVRLFAPFYNNAVGFPIRFLRIRTGSPQETIMLAVLITPFLYMLWLYYA